MFTVYCTVHTTQCTGICYSVYRAISCFPSVSLLYRYCTYIKYDSYCHFQLEPILLSCNVQNLYNNTELTLYDFTIQYDFQLQQILLSAAMFRICNNTELTLQDFTIQYDFQLQQILLGAVMFRILNTDKNTFFIYIENLYRERFEPGHFLPP